MTNNSLSLTDAASPTNFFEPTEQGLRKVPKARSGSRQIDIERNGGRRRADAVESNVSSGNTEPRGHRTVNELPPGYLEQYQKGGKRDDM